MATTAPATHSEQDQPPEYAEESPALAPLLGVLRSYRRAMLIAASVVLAVGVIGVVALAAFSPRERIGTVTFRLLFDGAEKGTYPNGTPFAPTEIVAAPVVEAVFRANDLQKYGRYDDLKETIYVTQANEAIQLLTLEYQARLSEPRLTAPERLRLEEEFRRRRDSLRDPQFSISLRRSERLATIPTAVIEKVLGDTLQVWAKQAAEKKGALKYDIPTLSQGMLERDFITSEDYVVAIDVIRSKVDRLIRYLDQVSTLPGANLVRSEPAQLTLAEIRLNLEDVVKFRLLPLMATVRAAGMSKDPEALSLYFESQLTQIRLDRQQAASRVQRLQESLRDYMTQRGGSTADRAQVTEGGASAGPVIPQLSETFLNRIVELATQNNDLAYRQALTDRIIKESLAATALDRELAYYEGMNRMDRVVRTVGSAGRNASGEEVPKRIASAIQIIGTAIDQVRSIYDALSLHNLTPSTLLYTQTQPFTITTVRSVGLRTLVVSAAAYFTLALLAIPLICLLHYFVWDSGQPRLRDTSRR